MISPGTPAPDRAREEQALCEEIGHHCPWRYNASSMLFDNLTEGRGERPALITDSGVWSYARLAALANRLGNTLLARGLEPGDRVALCLDDEPAYPAAVIGAMRAGLVPVLLNTLTPPELMRFYLEDSGARAAIASPDHVDLFSVAQRAGTACDTVITTGEAHPAGRETVDLARVLQASEVLEAAPTTRDDVAFWMYSSGSTGRPKGIVHRHEDPLYTYASYARHHLRLTPEDICFSIPKVFFAYGFGNSVTFPFYAGAASVLLPARPVPAAVFAQIARHRPTVLFGLPTLYTALVRHPAAESADLSSVRLCISAAEVLSADIFNAWRDRFGLEIVEGLGSTEVLHIYLSNDERARKTGSAGRRVPGYAVRLKNADGALVEPGTEGVLEVRGASAAREYWNRPDKTAETMRDGWIWTGDRFVADSDGFYFFKGRADDLVKISGQWVWPLEVELALNEHPQVRECAVLAVPLADRRMTLVAFISVEPGVMPDQALSDTLVAYTKRTLLPHKYPRRIEFLDALPKTGTDKIDRQVLKSRLE